MWQEGRFVDEFIMYVSRPSAERLLATAWASSLTYLVHSGMLQEDYRKAHPDKFERMR